MEAMVRLGGYADHEARERELRTRRAVRLPRRHGIFIGASGTQSCEAVIRDVSTHGCRIEPHPGWLRTGAIISLRADQGYPSSDYSSSEPSNAARPVMGIVRWVRGGAAGIEFLRPLTQDDDAWQALVEDFA